MGNYRADICQQNFGIAMGTPFAVTAANAFMFHHERDMVEPFSRYFHLYKRFIDDNSCPDPEKKWRSLVNSTIFGLDAKEFREDIICKYASRPILTFSWECSSCWYLCHRCYRQHSCI